MTIRAFPKNILFTIVFIGVAAILSIPIVLSAVYTQWRVWLPLVLWLLGGVCGYLVLAFDRFVDVLIARPETKLAFYVRQYLLEGKWREAIDLIFKNKHHQLTLVFRSALFQVIWVFLALFTITSTASFFGKGFVLGLGLHLLLDEWEDYFEDKAHLKRWLFWQINRAITDKELRVYLWSMTFTTAWFFWIIL